MFSAFHIKNKCLNKGMEFNSIVQHRLYFSKPKPSNLLTQTLEP